MSTKILFAALSLAIATGLWAMHERDNRLRAEGRAEVAERVVDSLTIAVELADTATAIAARTADSVRIVSDSVIAEADSLASMLRQRRPAVVDTIVREAGPDSAVVREAVERVAVSYEAEISQLQRATAAAEATIKAQADEIEALTIENRTQDALIANLRAQVEVVGRTNRGWIERNTDRLTWLGVGILAGYVGNEVTGG